MKIFSFLAQERGLLIEDIGKLTTYQIKHIYMNDWNSDKANEIDAVQKFDDLEKQRLSFFEQKLEEGLEEKEIEELWHQSLNIQFSEGK